MPELTQGTLRLLAFLIVLAAMIVLETLRPRRSGVERRMRWTTNFTLALTGALLVRLLLPAAAIGAALHASAGGIGLFNSLALPEWAALLLSVLLLDFAIWLQHLAFHKSPLLWRLHRMHHSDPALDVSTGLRFHPLEILISMIYKIAIVTAFGLPAMGVLAFEILLNATAMFNHGNLALPERLDRVLRLFLVTPDFHLVHHSARRDEHDANYGFSLPWWDFLFGTYVAEPKEGRAGMRIGLHGFDPPAGPGLLALLLLPFRKPAPSERP